MVNVQVAQRLTRNPAPARDAVVPERKVIHAEIEDSNLYKGKPSKASDEAWDDLFRCAMSVWP